MNNQLPPNHFDNEEGRHARKNPVGTDEVEPVNTCMDAPMILKDQAKNKRPMDKQYTIGIVLHTFMDQVLLIRKVKPLWQMGKLNFPGGHMEKGESAIDCVAREFKEETDLDIPREDWIVMGRIEGNGYQMMIYTAQYNSRHGIPKSLTVEEVGWEYLSNLLNGSLYQGNIISNIPWLAHLAINFHRQGFNGQDKLTFAEIRYED